MRIQILARHPVTGMCRYIALTCVMALLSSCGRTTPAASSIAQSSPSQSQSALVVESSPSAPSISQSDREKNALELCEITTSNTNIPGVDALESLQGQMRCVENFLDTNKSTQLWQKAYAIRAKVMMDSMSLIKALNTPVVNNGSPDLALDQQRLIERDKLKKLKSENYYYVYRAIQEITISMHETLFQQLKGKGMRMGEPKEQVSASNRVNKQVGVWESSVDEVRDGGQFIITRWVTEKTPMFVLEGYGTVSAMLKVEDGYFDENGAFSNQCKVFIGIADGRISYSCPEYLAGTNGQKIIGDMMAVVKESMAKQVIGNGQ